MKKYVKYSETDIQDNDSEEITDDTTSDSIQNSQDSEECDMPLPIKTICITTEQFLELLRSKVLSFDELLTEGDNVEGYGYLDSSVDFDDFVQQISEVGGFSGIFPNSDYSEAAPVFPDFDYADFDEEEPQYNVELQNLDDGSSVFDIVLNGEIISTMGTTIAYVPANNSKAVELFHFEV